MSYADRWCSKADILKDLALVTGRLGDVGDDYIVAGERPPPRRFEDEDDEFDLRFRQDLYDASVAAPDLQGITDMLRLLDPEEADNENKLTTETEIVISKLNPNVPEFVPKNNQSDVEDEGKSVVKDKGMPKGDKYNFKMEATKEVDENTPNNAATVEKPNIQIDLTKKIDVSNMDVAQIKDMASKLKSKISDTTSSSSKRQRNVAMAALLKLHSAMSPQKSPEKVEKPLKLMPPNYFETSLRSDDRQQYSSPSVPDEVQDSIEKVDNWLKNKTVASNSESSLARNGESPVETNCELPIARDCESLIARNGESPISRNGGSPIARNIESPISNRERFIARNGGSPVARNVKSPIARNLESPIAKNHESPVESLSRNAKSPIARNSESPIARNGLSAIAFPGKVSFKRKICSSPRPEALSSSSSTSDVKCTAVADFKPSKYAEGLAKKYTERVKAKALEEQRNMDVWTRVQLEMREREETMKKQSERNDQ